MVPQQQHHLLPHLFQFLLILSFSFVSVVFCDLAADRAALLRLRASIHGSTRRWNTSSPTPCQWEGVTCDRTINRVIAIRLPGDGLSGQLPGNTIGNLTQLQTLSLRHNSLSGPLPSDLGLCSELQNINLEDNRFSGDVPDGLFKLSNLSRVSLASNEFSGHISTKFNNLTKLRTLYLQNNHFNGSLPELNSLSDLTHFNVSFNNLNGSIPERLNGFLSESFLGNSLCGKPLASCPQSNGGGNKLSSGAIAGIVVGSAFGLVLFLLTLFILWRKYRGGKQSRQAEMSPLPPSPVKPQEYDFQSPRPFIAAKDYDSNNGSSRMTAKENEGRGVSNGGNGGLVFLGDNHRVFSLDELLRASAEVLGKGVIGTTYRAYLETGDDVVVKRLRNVAVSEKEFRDRVEKLGSLNHKNLVPLTAYFFGKDEKLLVFESLPMGSLHSILHGADRTSLTWVIRCRIALGAACGIEYLHSLGSNISHGNIKSSNILLNRYYDASLSEYGVTKLISPMSTSNLIGYRAPEVMDSRKVSQKADVYSFGVLLLELLTAKEPKTSLDEDAIDLPKWVRSVVQESWTIEVFDPELLRHQYSEEQMVQLLHLAISCTSHVPDKRPLMKDVTIRIKEICGVPPSD